MNAPARLNYVSEIDLSSVTTAGLDTNFTWALRSCSGDNGSLRLVVNVGLETMHLDDWYGPAKGIHERLTTDLPIAGTATGRPHTVAAVVNGSRVALYLDEARVADVPYSRCTNPNGRGIARNSFETGAPATVRITGARIYELP